MSKGILLFILLPLHIFAQEQVSDITRYGVYQPTNIRSTVGFAHIGGEQYLLEEKDSLVISKFEDGSFKYQSTIPNYDCKERTNYTFDPNRSLFEIRGRFYYRFLRDGIQVIDIVKGEIHYQYDFSTHGYEIIYPEELSQNRFYFSTRAGGGMYFDYFLDMSTSLLTMVETPNRQNTIQMGDLISGTESTGKVYIYNAHTNVDSLIYESLVGVRFISFSEHDSTFVILENDGALLKIDMNLNLYNLNCGIPNNERLKFFKVNGDKLISVYDYNEINVFQDSVFVIDLKSCEVDLSFTAEPIEYYSNSSHHVFTENNDKEFSIFGYRGGNPFDGFEEGLYFIIDHVRNIVTTIDDISFIQSHTPFVSENALYFVGVNSSFWSSLEYIVKYDFATSTIRKLDPNPVYTSEYVAMGYQENNQLISAINTYDEDPKVWGLTLEEDFSIIQPLDFLYNLGVNFINNILPREDRLYFTSNNCIYSVLDESRKEIFNDNNLAPIVGPSTSKLAVHGDKLAFMSFNNGSPKINILNTTTGEVDSILDNNVKTTSGNTLGPLIFYSMGNSDSKLHFFDLKDETINTFDDLPYMLSTSVTKGKNTAFYYHSPFNDADRVYLIDYTTNEFKLINMDIAYHKHFVSGNDDSYYIIDRDFSADSSRIRLLTKDGNITEIYHGKGRFNEAVTSFEDHAVTKINLLFDGKKSIFVTNDLQNTTVFELPHSYSISRRLEILNSKNGKSILRTVEDTGVHYWFYQAFEPVVEIESTTNKTLAFSDLSNGFVNLVFYDQDDFRTSLVRYNYGENVKSKIEDVENGCDGLLPFRGIALNASQYLIAASCDSGSEPWILDMVEGNIKLIEDFYPGRFSSSPNDFIKFKDWIYFVMTKKDRSRQWFRMAADFPDTVIEVKKDESNQLKIYPSPASDAIFVEGDLNQISIYSINGQLIYNEINYKNKQSINIDFLPNGSYMVIGLDKAFRSLTGSFVKIN